jgi:hypothetical protein
MVVGAIVTAIIGFVYWRIKRKKRELVYAINPISTKLVVAGQETKLKVSYDKKPLGNVNITVVQIAIWNTGEETIGKDDHYGNIPAIFITDKITKILYKY